MSSESFSLITYEEAQERCNAAHSKCIEHWFDSLCTNKGDFIQKSEFQADFADRMSSMPVDICRSLFNIFDTTHNDCLVYEDFFCGIVLLINGTVEEHATITYRIMREIQGKDKPLLADKVAVFNDSFSFREGTDYEWQKKRIEDLLTNTDSYRRHGCVTEESFVAFCKENQSCPISIWINRLSKIIKQSFLTDQQMGVIDTTCSPIENKSSTITQKFYDSIAKVPLVMLTNSYSNLSHIGEQGFVTRTQWMNEIGKFLRKHLAAALFNSFFVDDEEDEIDFIVVIAAMLIISPTQVEKRFVTALHIYQSRCNAAGIYTYQEVLKLLCAGVSVLSIEESVKQDMGDDIIEPIYATIGTQNQASSIYALNGQNRMPSCNVSYIPDTKTYDVNQREANSLCIKLCNDIFSTVNSPYVLVDRSIELSELVKWLSKHNNAYTNLLSTLTKATTTSTQIALTLDDERSIYNQLYTEFDEENITMNERYYILSKDWWDKWTKYILSDNDENEVTPQRPGYIDNTPILEPDHQMLLSEIQENTNFIIIPEDLWSQLYVWYGGGPPIPRRVIRTSDGELELELYPLRIDICLLSDEGKPNARKEHIICSKSSTAKKMKERACKFLHLQPNNCRIWRKDGGEDGDYLIQDENRTLEDLDFYEEQTIMIEVKINDQWLSETIQGKRKYQQNITNGLIGLTNLGNTCYMNACLQCLTHLPLFVDYFENDYYLYDLNAKNATPDSLACSFSELIKTIYQTEQNVIAPRKFKQCLGQKCSRFRGYEQHDAQEALSKILESLGDELNRVTEKEYYHMRYSDRPNTEVANEWWHYQISREKSIITALFAGQHQSISQCVGCECQSIRYEVFNQIELDVPSVEKKVLSLILCYSDGRPPIRCCLRVPVNYDINTLSQKLYNLDSALALSGKHLRMTRVENSNVIEEFNNIYKVEQFQGDHFTAFILPSDQDILGYNAYMKWKSQRPLFWVEKNCEVEVIDDGYAYEDEMKDSSSPIKTKKGIVKQEISSYVFAVEFEDGTIENVSLSRIVDAEYLMPMPNEPIAVIYSVAPNMKKLQPYIYKEVNKSNPNEHLVTDCIRNKVTSVSLDLIKFREPQPRVIYVIQRRPRYNPDGFLSSHTPKLCGIPVPLYLYPDFVTGKEIYEYVRKHFYKLYNTPLQESVKYSTTKTTGIETSNSRASTTIQSMSFPYPLHFSSSQSNPTVYEHPFGQDKDMTEEEKEEYAMNKTSKDYGFVLRFIDNKGISCSRCHWLKGCQGCFIKPDDQYVYHLNVVRKIALDWNSDCLNYNKMLLFSENVLTHKSVDDSNNANKSYLTLYELMEQYTKTNIYNKDLCIECPFCKSITNHYQTTKLYRLPPILVIYLKRFYKQKNRTKKVNSRIEFPLKDFDLSDFTVHDIQEDEEADLTYWEYLGGKYNTNNSNEPPKEMSNMERLYGDDKGEHDYELSPEQSLDMTIGLLDGSNMDDYYNDDFNVINLDDLQETYLTSAHKDNEEMIDENERDIDDSDYNEEKQAEEVQPVLHESDPSITDELSSCTKYDLYGVIRHKGTLQEGHYTACILAPDNQWYFVSDSTFTPIPLDNVCTRDAYLLFYVRQDVEDKDVKDFFKLPANVDPTETKVEEKPSKKKKGCCIS